MSISVVIPALDESERIEAALRSAEGRPGGPAVERLVVDGGSRDDTASRAERAGARVLHTPPGRARQLDAGARAARGEVLLFLHADTQLPPGWADAVAAALRDPLVAGGAFRFAFDEAGPALRVIEWGARLRSRLGLPYGDQALFVRRKVLEALGGVPQVPVMEDLDLVHGLRRHGRLVLLPGAVRTSARRYRRGGVLRTMLLHWLAAAAWAAGVDRARVAAWVRR